MGELILVPEYKKVKGPVIFLAGPIQESEDYSNIPLFDNLEDACDAAIFLTQSSQDLGVQ